MADFPQPAAIPFNPAAYIAETRQMTPEERGCYVLILCYIWECHKFSLENHSDILNILGINAKRWARIRPAINRFLSPYEED